MKLPKISTVSFPPLSVPKKCSTSASPTPPATLPVTKRSLCLAPTEVEERMTSLTCEGGSEGGREGGRDDILELCVLLFQIP